MRIQESGYSRIKILMILPMVMVIGKIVFVARNDNELISTHLSTKKLDYELTELMIVITAKVTSELVLLKEVADL